MSLQYIMFQYIEYERQRTNDAPHHRDKLLMNLGFTESKVDSNLYFKVEGRRPVMFLLCVDALFF